MASDFNATVVAIGGIVTVAITGYTAWVGARSKGRDQQFASAQAYHDNLQEDLKEARAEVVRERERADRMQAACDGCHATVTALRVEHDNAIKAEIERQRQIRHGFAAGERRALVRYLRLRSYILQRDPTADLSFLDQPIKDDELI